MTSKENAVVKIAFSRIYQLKNCQRFLVSVTVTVSIGVVAPEDVCLGQIGVEGGTLALLGDLL